MTEDPLQQNDDSSDDDPSTRSRRRSLCQTRHPVIPIVVWIALNAAALAASLFLAVQLMFAVDDWHSHNTAAGWYLLWNFATTTLWVVEVSCRVYDWSLYHHRRRQTQSDEDDSSRSTVLGTMTTVDSIELVVEWTFAVLFTIDSIKLLIKWKVRKQDIEEDLVEVVLNIIAFGYITIATLQDYHEEKLAARGSDNENYQHVGQGSDDEKIPNDETPLVV